MSILCGSGKKGNTGKAGSWKKGKRCYWRNSSAIDYVFLRQFLPISRPRFAKNCGEKQSVGKWGNSRRGCSHDTLANMFQEVWNRQATAGRTTFWVLIGAKTAGKKSMSQWSTPVWIWISTVYILFEIRLQFHFHSFKLQGISFCWQCFLRNSTKNTTKKSDSWWMFENQALY